MGENATAERSGYIHRYNAQQCALYTMVVTIAERIHLFPSRTQKLSSLTPKVLGLDPGRIGSCHLSDTEKHSQCECFSLCFILANRGEASRYGVLRALCSCRLCSTIELRRSRCAFLGCVRLCTRPAEMLPFLVPLASPRFDGNRLSNLFSLQDNQATLSDSRQVHMPKPTSASVLLTNS